MPLLSPDAKNLSNLALPAYAGDIEIHESINLSFHSFYSLFNNLSVCFAPIE